MADYYVGLDGNVTKNRKKKNSHAYTVDSNGKVTKTIVSAPVNKVSDDIAPIKTITTEEDENKKWYQGWLKKSEGNFGQAVKASGVDLSEDVGTGIIGSGEKLLDALMAFSPAMSNMNKINAGQMLTQEDWEEHDRQKKNAEEFIKKDLYDEAEVARRIITDPFEKRTGIDVESMSVFDEKADSLAQSAGQMGVTIGASLINPTLGTTLLGATSFGSEMENALKEGATYEEAVISGAITAGAEILTEKLSGGISLGGKTLDDLIPMDKLAQGISNKVVRNLIKIGVDATGEGFEEIVAGVFGAIGQKLTYMEEKELKELFSSEEAIDSFLGGAILGGLSSTGKTAINTVEGKDSLSGLKKNEKAVFDKFYNDTIAEREADGKKLTQKEKNKIYDEISEAMERGTLDTDTIGSMFAEESYKQYKESAEKEEADLESPKAKLEELNTQLKFLKGQKGQVSDEQNSKVIENLLQETKNQIAETEKVIEEIKNTSDKFQLQSKMDSEAYELLKGTKLAESYHDKARRGQEIEVDVESYTKESAKKTAQNFKEFGANNSRASHDFLEFATNVSEAKDHTFRFMTSKQLEESIENGNPYNLKEDASDIEAFIDKKNKEIIINMDANKSLTSLVGHEITHSFEKANGYSDLENHLFKLAEIRGEYDSRWESVQRRYKNLSEAEQKQELVSDLVGDYVFGDSDFISNLSTENPNIFKKIYNEIKYLWKMATAGSKEYRELERVKREFEKIWQEASEAVSDSDAEVNSILEQNGVQPVHRQGEDVGLDKFGFNEDGTIESNDSFKELDGGSVIKYSLATWTDETKAKAKDNLIKAGHDAMKVDKWIKDVNSVASVIASDKERLGFEAADNQTMLKNNQEYVKTLDASTLCAKRLLYQGTFDAIQHRLPNTMLSSDDLIGLLNMMKKHGKQTPCGVCYVESRRRHLGKFAQEWLNGYEGAYKPNLDEVTTSDGLEALRKSHPDTYNDFVNAMNKKGSANPKVVQLRTEYRNEILSLTPAQIRKIESIGGLRVQSFSDFETPHLLDMMQAVVDMSSKGLTSQAYTKVPNFAWVFGDTGIKINLSLISEGDGFDADGKLAFSSVEGMDINDAMALRDAYSENVGTIIVGANDKHILACMADDRIDYIIPFHRSGWGSKELEMMGMDSYKDYTYGQNEHNLETGKNVSNLYPPDYWDYNLSGKENAERYLRLCEQTGREPKFSEFLVNNGDGSYSLQPDGSTDGYWKTLIDFKMYDNNGNGAAQQKVQPNFNMTEAMRVLKEYEGGANKLPVANDVVEEFVAQYERNIAPVSDVRYSLSEKTENVSDRLSMSEWKQVKTAVADYTIRNYHYEKSSDGDIIIPINNKLVYTDADYDSPGISKIIEFESEYEDDIDFARKELYAVEKGESTYEEAQEIIRLFTGIENINKYETKNRANAGKYDKRTSRGKSQSDTYHNNFLQERIRRANEIISSVNRETSSEDGVFFDGKTRIADDSYTSKEYGRHIYSEDVAIAPTTESLTMGEKSLPVEEKSLPISGVNDDDHIVGEDLTKKNAERIRTIQAEIKGHYLTKDITKKEFDEKIAQKESQYESLSRKDTKKAVDLRNQITKLETKRDSLLRGLDGKIERANKRIESIESESRFAKRKTKQNEYRELFGRLMGDTSTWKDKKMGIQYQTNTLRRNLRDIVRDASGNQDIARADAIYDELQGSVNRNEAKKNREANDVKNVFREMKINNAESTYIQMLGELRHNPDTTLTKEVVEEYYKKHKNKIDTDKVDKAIDEARKLYDSLYDRVNAALSEHGFKEIGYRKGYFPHFNDPKQNWLAKLLNWKVNNDEIPTDIAGLTEMFEPQRTWQSFDKHRMTDTTDYNFLKGLDNYVNGSLDWIYHIEDIQKHRAFETEIRYRHSSEQVQKKIDEYRNNPMLSNEEVEALIESALREAKNPLNNFVTDLHTRTNILAGKKSSKDRNMESDFNRHAYSVMTNLTNRVTANQVVGSISSAMTNFIPITQSWGQVNPTSSLVGMKQTIQSYAKDDGVVAKSDFLTNRLAMNEALYKDAWDKIGDKVGGLMEVVDNFTSQTVWRSKYLENIKNGMTEAQAIKDADQFAENVIAGRSKGNMPTIFHAKNPVTKMLTAFQLEVANQYGYMFKDMPQDIGKKAVGKLVKGYATMFIGAYAYNALYSTLTGRDAALDPLGILKEFFNDLVGDDDEEKDVAGAIAGLASNVADEIPFIGGLLGGGRIPISSALPYNASISDAYADVVDKDWKSVLDELSKPLYYGVLPMGGGQIRKHVQGMQMFDEDLPVSGSYTKSGSLRFPVEDTFLNRLQAGVFGQYASSNAREYFDRGQTPLKEKQIQEYIDVDLPISEYWDYREGLKGLESLSDKADYINSLDLPIAKKNILVNNHSDRKEPIDLTGFDDDYENFDEFDFAVKNPEKYDVALKVGGYKRYKEITEGMSGMTKLEEKIDYISKLKLSTEQKNALANSLTDRKEPLDLTGYEKYGSYDEFKLATESPTRYSASRVIGYDDYVRYKEAIDEIEGEKDANGKTKRGTEKKNRRNYIFSLDLDYGQKCILYRSEYNAQDDKDEFNEDIVKYLDSRDDISYEEYAEILEALEMKLYPDGRVTW